ncbi:NRAMP (natural resistance-associated macrophage protein)-like metal ion transporter [Janthinobacterium sp. CG_23.3]|uniref:NRAMP family divalent metal transporter n=1 Tax=unclassified Janthinobacterium TaxID=2610881 RepID=UPI00034A9C4D|nr:MULTISPECIES: divalent metal cation transporter [unclassified Janthinobacterium]MEC5161479.1 NRAMP (natural resistance-associated macrophage protein)-like metal ion transporter [Janthinobacterium sp. CG_S6]
MQASATGKVAEKQASQTWLGRLGPGLIAGAADDDPSGIATYSQAGAQFGFGLLWTILFTYPLMVGIQIVSAKIGCVSGHGLATNIRRHYPAWLLHAIVGLLLVANTINIAADVAAMGQALALLVPGPAHLFALGFGLVSILLQLCVPYGRYVRILKWLTLALLAYFAAAMALNIPWADVARSTLLPQLQWDRAYVTTVVALFGTTISPYLFFWQASQEVEDLNADPRARALRKAPELAPANFQRIKVDTFAGMAFSNLVAFFIMLTSALALHAHGLTDIGSAADAANALRPVAGEFAFVLFSVGIIGTGLLAVPVLAGSAAYAVAGAFKWKNSLALRPSVAKEFYGIVVLSTLIGVALCFTKIDPFQALYWSAVINGVISVPIMAVMMLMAARADVMGRLTISRRLAVLGWLCTGVMAAAVATMAYVSLAGA